MPTTTFLVGLLVQAAATVPATHAEASNPRPAYDLGPAAHTKVLYAGVPGTERARTFVEFLAANFDEVGEIDVTELSAATAAPYDVVVCDGKRIYPMDPKAPALNLPKLELDPSFTKPIVMIASMAGTVQHHTKIDWL